MDINWIHKNSRNRISYVTWIICTVLTLIGRKLKKITILTFGNARFLVKVVTCYIKVHYKNPRMRIFLR